MGRESLETLQFFLEFKINHEVKPNDSGHDLMQKFKKWHKYEKELSQKYEEEFNKIKQQQASSISKNKFNIRKK